MTTIIAIDGPAASGKSTTARLVAEKLGFVHLDTGAMYRAVTLAALREGVRPEQTEALAEMIKSLDIRFRWSGDGAQRVLLNGADVTDAIRTPEVNKLVSAYSAVPFVRERLLVLQRNVGQAQDVVCEGRDIGTRVFPDARYKFFLVADLEVRAGRRLAELRTQGHEPSLNDLMADLRRRDKEDASREHSPLLKACDAIEVDTSTLTIPGQVDYILQVIEKDRPPTKI